MSDPALDQFGLRVQAIASTFNYPPTPNIAASVQRRIARSDAPAVPVAKRRGEAQLNRRRLAFAAIAVVLALGALLAVPQVRAAIIEFFQIGVVRIFPVAPTLTPTPTGTHTAPPPTPTLMPSLLNLEGETTLAEAAERAGFTISLPTYPGGFGPPDRVFLQDMDGSFLVMVWLDKEQPGQVALSLHIIAPGSFAIQKVEPVIIQTTSVNGRDAYWTEGPYILRLQNGNVQVRRLIEGHVLIWTDDNLTYRLETDASMEEAVKIAESLEAIK